MSELWHNQVLLFVCGYLMLLCVIEIVRCVWACNDGLHEVGVDLQEQQEAAAALAARADERKTQAAIGLLK